MQADSDTDAHEWVDIIRREARIDEHDDEFALGSPVVPHKPSLYKRFSQGMRINDDRRTRQRHTSSSPEPMDTILSSSQRATTRLGIRIPSINRPAGNHTDQEYSGPDVGSYSDFSDSAPPRPSFAASVPLSTISSLSVGTLDGNTASSGGARPSFHRNASQMSGLDVVVDEERVLYHGYLLCLRSKGGVRSWKKLWVVLRSKNLAFYKNEEVRFPFTVSNHYNDAYPAPAGIFNPPPHPPLAHPLRRRNRPRLALQGTLHADHRREQVVPVLCRERGGAGAMAGRAEKSTGETEGKGKGNGERKG